MKFRNLLFSALTLCSLQASAQLPTPWVSDSVEMSASYVNDVYYSMKNGAVGTPIPNNDWHLGFEMIPGGPGFGGVSIIANHVRGGIKVYSLHTTGTAKFGTLTAGDTASMTLLYNSDSSWDNGALNANASSTLFDYGWGKYNSTTHFVEGDSLYLLYVAGAPYQMVINHYHSFPTASIYYAFRLAKFDGSTPVSDTIRKSAGYMSKNFAYYNVLTNSDFNREPDQNTWDVLFTRYIEYVAPPPPATGLAPYPVTGVLSNVGVLVADVRNVVVDTAKYTGRSLSKKMCEIGSDWKSFNMTTFAYDVDTMTTFFVQAKDSSIYQIRFTGFVSSAGRSVFAKRKVFNYTPASVGSVSSNIVLHTLVPNPANYNADFVLNAKEAAEAQLVVTDITGKILQNTPVKLNSGLNALRINTGDYATGTYMVTITNGTWKVTEKLAVQH